MENFGLQNNNLGLHCFIPLLPSGQATWKNRQEQWRQQIFKFETPLYPMEAGDSLTVSAMQYLDAATNVDHELGLGRAAVNSRLTMTACSEHFGCTPEFHLGILLSLCCCLLMLLLMRSCPKLPLVTVILLANG